MTARTIAYDGTLDAIAYRNGYSLAYDYVWMARARPLAGRSR
jgi:hypothetical protein